MGTEVDKNTSGTNTIPDFFSVPENSSKILSVTKDTSQEMGEILQAMNEDSAIIEELYKALSVIQKDKADSIEYTRIRNFAWHRVPLSEISTDIKNFQNRRKPYSEHSAQGIVDAVRTGEFKWKMFTPALLWRKDDGMLYVLAGHSRDEAFKRLSTTYKDDDAVKAYCEKHNCHFEDLPSLILNDIDFDGAKMIAGMSNALATAETDVERADIYRHMRMMGRDKKLIEEFGRRCEKNNRSRVRSFSHLAPNGMAMDMLYAFETGEDNNYVIKRISYRIGELRRKNPEISDMHEGELFDRLLNKGVYGKNKNKGEISKMDIFIDIVEKHIHQLKTHNEFAPDQLLNITKIKDISYVMKYYYDTLNAYSTKKNLLLKESHALRRRISQLRATTKVSDDNRMLFQQLEEQLQTSFKPIDTYTDADTATGMLFNTEEVYLSPDEEILRCEKKQQAILQTIIDIETKGYVHRGKQDGFQNDSKTVMKIDFTAGQK